MSIHPLLSVTCRNRLYCSMPLNALGSVKVGLLVVSIFVVPSRAVRVHRQCMMLLYVLEVSTGLRSNGPQELLSMVNPALGLAYRVSS